MSRYTLELENDQLLNIIPLVKFLKENEDQHITLTANQESHCLKSCEVYKLIDLFKFKSVTIESLSAIESHSQYTILHDSWAHWLNIKKIKTHNFSIDYTWNQTKVFGCFYGRPTAARLGITSYLATHYLEKSLIKIRFDKSHEDTRKHFELTKLFSWDIDSLDNVNLLLKTLPKSEYAAYDYQTGEYDYGNELSNLYSDIFVDVICEANYLGDSFYPTEKIARAMLCKKPFIVMAPKYYLKYLKQMGFKTFDRWWSESYDDLSAKDRYFSILKLLDYIALLSTDKLLELNDQLMQIVDHNYNLLVDQKFNKDITRIDN